MAQLNIPVPTFKIVPEFLHDTSAIGNIFTFPKPLHEINMLYIFSNLNQGIQEVRYLGCRIPLLFA